MGVYPHLCGFLTVGGEKLVRLVDPHSWRLVQALTPSKSIRIDALP